MAQTAVKQGGSSDKLSLRNLLMFPIGTIGRDFLYNFFNGYLLSFCVFTKHLNVAQFSAITIIIVAARIFDAFNDPIMGGIVENTRTKWGKYKPWQLIGAALTAGVIIALFNIPVDGWSFIALLAVMYFLFSITFTMNDISYWGMMPTLTSDAHDRDKLTSFTQIMCAIGGGLAGLIVPMLTNGDNAIGGSAATGYGVLAIVAAVLMFGFQLFTIFGVQEKPLPKNLLKTPPLKLKDMFRVLIKNDQLLWCALVMLLFNIGTNVVGGGLGMMYVYFEFGYNGMLWTVFGLGFAVVSTLFTLFYPWLSKKYGRDNLLYSCGIAIIVGYGLMMILGLTVPNILLFEVLGMQITLRFVLMLLAYTVAGWGGGFYMIMVINMANTVEYNEYKTGKREEGLIFSLRPFTAKMGSALMQGLVSLVYIIAGVVTYTNQLTDIDRGLGGDATYESVIAMVPDDSKIKLLVFTCVIPMVFLAVALIIYKKKCFLNEKKMSEMLAVIEERKEEQRMLEDYQECAAGAQDVFAEEIAFVDDAPEQVEFVPANDVLDEVAYDNQNCND